MRPIVDARWGPGRTLSPRPRLGCLGLRKVWRRVAGASPCRVRADPVLAGGVRRARPTSPAGVTMVAGSSSVTAPVCKSQPHVSTHPGSSLLLGEARDEKGASVQPEGRAAAACSLLSSSETARRSFQTDFTTGVLWAIPSAHQKTSLVAGLTNIFPTAECSQS